MPTRASDLARRLPGIVLAGESDKAAFARDQWPLATARVRRGEPPSMPLAVVVPTGIDDVRRLLAWCSEHGVGVVACGGRSGVCGGVAFDRDAVALDMRGLRGVEVMPDDLLAEAMAGTPGPEWEAALEAHGLTGGHYPQSLAISTVGGWLACRSAGQFSTAYGKAEDRLAGLEVVLASGDLLSVAPRPSSAAGPDLARLFCGSEGTLGVIASATMRVVPRTERVPTAFRFERFIDGLDAVRGAVHAGLRPAVVRLYDPDDTAWSFDRRDGCLLVVVCEGPLGRQEANAFGRIVGGARVGRAPAKHWLEHRFDAVRTFEEVMRPDGPLGPNVIADTMEVAGPWSGLETLYEAVREALLPHALGVLCHASHVYPDGACLYFTFALQGDDEHDAEDRYHEAWTDGMEATLAAGGTITHHHGVGRLKAQWLRRELGETGWETLVTIKRALDPAGILNPGNLGLS